MVGKKCKAHFRLLHWLVNTDGQVNQALHLTVGH